MLGSFILVFVKIFPQKLHINLSFNKALLQCFGLSGQARAYLPYVWTLSRLCDEMLVNELEPHRCGVVWEPDVDVYKLIV